jgi:hypothetical protein
MRALSIVILLIGIGSATLAKETPPITPKPKETPADTADAKKPTKIEHAAIGATVTVSSTAKGSEGENGANVLVDGDLTTRWSSEYSTPQRITIDLKKKLTLKQIKLHWEAAFATKYKILISDDGEGWTPAHFFFRVGAKKDARTDMCDMKNMQARHIMIELNERVNEEWGFSLYEIEVIPTTEVVIP